jgi:elongation factor Ts
MANVTAEMVKKLRDRTGTGMMDCKNALVECGGDEDKAVELLRVKGLAAAKKKAGREANEGVIASYIHPGDKLGVLVEINCETDFVARTDDFREIVKNIAMHIAASDPLAVDRDGIPEDLLETEKKIIAEQAKESGKPENVIGKIVEGRLNKYYEETCLLEQPYVKNPDVNIKEYIDSAIGKLGENIVVRRFVRFKLGEE